MSDMHLMAALKDFDKEYQLKNKVFKSSDKARNPIEGVTFIKREDGDRAKIVCIIPGEEEKEYDRSGLSISKMKEGYPIQTTAGGKSRRRKSKKSRKNRRKTRKTR